MVHQVEGPGQYGEIVGIGIERLLRLFFPGQQFVYAFVPVHACQPEFFREGHGVIVHDGVHDSLVFRFSFIFRMLPGCCRIRFIGQYLSDGIDIHIIDVEGYQDVVA